MSFPLVVRVVISQNSIQLVFSVVDLISRGVAPSPSDAQPARPDSAPLGLRWDDRDLAERGSGAVVTTASRFMTVVGARCSSLSKALDVSNDHLSPQPCCPASLTQSGINLPRALFRALFFVNTAKSAFSH